MTAATKRIRESASKVRTGCTTCKARRVKCDEAKPTCRQCSLKGRNCEYQTVRAAQRRGVITVYLPPAKSQPVAFANTRGLGFFHRKIAANLDGQFDSRFWSTLVLQLSHSEPSVRCALSAISITYQDVEASLQHPAGYVDANPEARQALGAAMKYLSARIQDHPNSRLVPLVCCLLFTCIEFLAGNVESSMLHVQSGSNIVAALNCDNSNTATTDLVSSSDVKTIDDHIIPIFSRLNVLCSLAGRTAPPIYTPTATEDTPHDDLTDSRTRLINIINLSLHFINQAITKAATSQLTLTDIIEQTKLQSRLETWHHHLNALITRTQTLDNPSKQDAINLLLVHYKAIHIWLRVCTTPGEMASDAYFPDFTQLVHYAEKLIKPDARKSIPQPLSFDVQLLAPLYDTALKCRHPAIRRRALDLLLRVPRREGIWNAHHAYVTARRVIEVEEGTLGKYKLPDETARLRSLPLPDERGRIFEMGVLPFGVEKLGHTVVLSPVYPGAVEGGFFDGVLRGVLGCWESVR